MCVSGSRRQQQAQALGFVILAASVSIIILGVSSLFLDYQEGVPSLAEPVHLAPLLLGDDTSHGCDNSGKSAWARLLLPDEVILPAHCPSQPRALDTGKDSLGFNESELDALRPLVTTASLRNGYRYQFMRGHAQDVPVGRLVLENRLMCMNRMGEWTVFSTSPKDLMPTEIDAAAAAEMGMPLMGAERIHAAWHEGKHRTSQRAIQTAAGLLNGRMVVAPQFLFAWQAWSARPASNTQWRAVLQLNDLWPCTETPAKQPRCLRSYISARAELLARRTAGSPIGQQALGRTGTAQRGVAASILFGTDDGGNIFAWSAGCTRCLLKGVLDGVFLMWQPRWLLHSPLAMSSRGRHLGVVFDKPTCLLAHWNCTLKAVDGRNAQCALPIWQSGEHQSAGGGDTTQDTATGKVELLNRTAFISYPIWATHFTHKLFQYLLPMAVLMHDLRASPSRDVLVLPTFEQTDDDALDLPTRSGGGVDVSSLVDAPLLQQPGVLGATSGTRPTDVALSCFGRSVIGTAGICPGRVCQQPMHEAAMSSTAAVMRKRLGVPPPPTHLRRPHNVYIIQRATATRSIINVQQLHDMLMAFGGLRIRELRLEGASLQEQAALFSNASIVVAAHGNALGNLLWLPKGSAVFEYLGHGFETGFFSQVGLDRDMVWLQGRCEENLLGKALDAAFVQSVLDKIAERPKVAWLVEHRTKSALLDVQRKIEQNMYSIPRGVKLAKASQDASINYHPTAHGEMTCLLESIRADTIGKDAKDRHVFVPPRQFLSNFLEVVLQWEKWL